MNYKDPKTQITIFIVLLFIGATYFWYTKVFTSFADKIAVKSVQYEKELQDLHAVKQKAATLVDLQREFEDLEMRYKKVELLLPEKKEDEAFLSQLHAAAQLTGSTVKELTPLGAQVGEFYNTNSYSIEVEASYHGLGRFFAKVANFPFIVNVSDLEMKTAKGVLAGIGTIDKDPEKTLIATFKMSTYNVKQDATG
jgi:Tfp pilus assembly protein PilO